MNTDKTIENNYLRIWGSLVRDYELIKEKKHPKYKFVTHLFSAKGLSRQTFYKYYARYRESSSKADLMPQRRGPKWKSRRPDAIIEQAVIEARHKGLGRYEIYALLLPRFAEETPSVSGIYNILRRHNMSRLSQPQKAEKRKIIKARAGQMGHVDCHFLPQNVVSNTSKRYYLVGLIDDHTRIAWVEVVDAIKSLDVMFNTLKIINYVNLHYGIQYEEILSDNGVEFTNHNPKTKVNHPFERMLLELGIRHRYTRPYRPQTNGKIERFWRTLHDDLIDGTTFESEDALREELCQYLIYYNEKRPHQALNGLPPKQFLTESCQRIS